MYYFVNYRRLLAIPALLFAFFFTSCESTLDYGYYVGQLDDQSILQLFALTDESANNRDFDSYKSFFSPGFVTVDSSDYSRSRLYREDYLNHVHDLFEDASYIEMRTVVMDIQYSESGDSATVKVQEEEKAKVYGDKWHYTSIVEVDVGIDDGWIYIDRTNRTSKQVIEDNRF